MSQRPEVEAAVVAELSAAGLLATKASPNPPHIGLDDLARLPYLACVCKVRPSMHAYTRSCTAATRSESTATPDA